MKRIVLLMIVSFLLVFAPAQAENGRVLFAAAVPLKTVRDDVSFAELADMWNGKTESGILYAEEDAALLAQLFGTDGIPEYALNSADLLSACTQNGSLALIPFDRIEPRWKILTVDGANILSNQFDPEGWPLTAVAGEGGPVLNRDAEKLTTMILTGVTAMTRSTAQYMDLDPLYPASLIREPLVQADILHINNEVPFQENCSMDPEDMAALRFCSKARYMDLLTDIGTDVLELDGDHFQDHGDEAVYYTLDLYDEVGIPYYGGGHNKAEAQKPLLITHNGNRFAFIGCNGKEKGYAAASETRPGAVHCDIPLIVEQVQELSREGIIPIVTFQHLEVYKENPVDEMRADFEAVHDAGAVIVSGSQSHIPMEFDAYPDSFIHFGLGNLFFDQAFFLPNTAIATLDRHVFYDGKYINTEFLTIRFTNCALSHYMDADDRAALLTDMFSWSRVGGLE